MMLDFILLILFIRGFMNTEINNDNNVCIEGNNFPKFR